MANFTNDSETTKITVAVPKALLVRLSESVPSRQRSRFIVQAVEDRLDIDEQVTALAETAGAWPDERYPELNSEEDIDRWLSDLRRSWDSGEEGDNGQILD